MQKPGVSLSLELKVLDSCEIYSVSLKGAPSKAGTCNGSSSLNVLKVMLRIFKGISSSPLGSQYWIKDRNGQVCHN